MTDKGIKLAHFSDLHLSGRKDRKGLGRLDTLFSVLVENGCSHIIITGDLYNSTEPEDWASIRNLLEKKGLYSWDRVTIVPGNHDLINLEEEMRFYNVLNPDNGSRVRRLRRKLDTFCSDFREIITGDESVAGFPYIKTLDYGDVSLALVMVNTVFPWHNIDNPLGARGRADKAQLKALYDPSVKKALRNSFVIGVIHHAYRIYETGVLLDQAFDWTMELKNRKNLLAVMQHLDARLLLHGHFHRFQTYSAGGIQVVNGGSFSLNHRRYNQVTIKANGTFEQRFVDVGGGGGFVNRE